ncbi:MAG: RNA polymerase sigma factor [Prevotella sp.]|nr:RNA polymerase sigma factor [Prevotella sp.]
MTAQDKESLGQRLADEQPKLRSFIRKRVANRDDAEDILQDVLFQCLKTVDTAMNPIENLSAWLFRVARNMIINWGVRKKEDELPVYRNSDNEMMSEISDVLFTDENTAPSPETEYLRSLVWVELENALAELPPEQRSIFELTEFDAVPVKEISETTGVPVATLLSRKHYAILHLRKRLAYLYADLAYN